MLLRTVMFELHECLKSTPEQYSLYRIMNFIYETKNYNTDEI